MKKMDDPLIWILFAAILPVIAGGVSAIITYKAGKLQAVSAGKDKQDLLDKAERDKQDLLSKNESLNAELKDMRSELSGKSDEITTLSHRLGIAQEDLSKAQRELNKAQAEAMEINRDLFALVNGANSFCYFYFRNFPDTTPVEVVHNGSYPLKRVTAFVFTCPKNYEVSERSFKVLTGSPPLYDDGSKYEERVIGVGNVNSNQDKELKLMPSLNMYQQDFIIRFRGLNGDWLQHVKGYRTGPRQMDYRSSIYRLINGKVIKLI